MDPVETKYKTKLMLIYIHEVLPIMHYGSR